MPVFVLKQVQDGQQGIPAALGEILSQEATQVGLLGSAILVSAAVGGRVRGVAAPGPASDAPSNIAIRNHGGIIAG
jgi:hypothetical protein